MSQHQGNDRSIDTPPEAVSGSALAGDRETRQPYRAPKLSLWGSLEELTLGPIFPNDDMDGTGSQPI